MPRGICQVPDIRPFQYHPLFPPGKDPTPYRMLASDGVRIETVGANGFLRVEREALRHLAGQAMRTSIIFRDPPLLPSSPKFSTIPMPPATAPCIVFSKGI